LFGRTDRQTDKQTDIHIGPSALTGLLKWSVIKKLTNSYSKITFNDEIATATVVAAANVDDNDDYHLS